MVRPQHEFYIPSVHDGTRLSCRLYQSELTQRTLQQPSVSKGAIVAHPYATLGGNNDDPAVGSIAAELVRNGYAVLTLNFRGAGYSDGRTSWTAKPEIGDYMSAYGFMLKYLQLLGPSKPVELILAGYSYGSMVASHQPTIGDVASLFATPEAGSPVETILLQARDLVEGANKDVTESNDKLDQDSKLPAATISYLLLSPILPPASRLVTLWANLSSVSIAGKQISIPAPEEELPKHRTLVVYGTDDMFTSETKLRHWTKSLREVQGSHAKSVEISFAGHFWIEQTFHTQLRKAISDWFNDTQ
ncbi:Alpha/Beta hydrolase protein [Talaromyces proteolyticus]|uniref:Alpha/Beta hydrolase protein n=1 Tax=Talaromyces proteolyticus TaxID=1131652 RepID=A0AAD4KUD4_9EURO|nr:Alpha/Beta hydrolase protein [Talaromyces proteolyticus]KAH8700156.1 Alpha/Beta hydrolase protein [Talaromyces proteolyticus]